MAGVTLLAPHARFVWQVWLAPSNPAVYLPQKRGKTPSRTYQSTKKCASQLLPIMLIMQLGRNIPWTTMTSIVFCFGHLNRKKGRNSSWTKIPRPNFCEKNNYNYQLLNCGRYADGCSPLEVVSHTIFLCRSALILIYFSHPPYLNGNLDDKNINCWTLR